LLNTIVTGELPTAEIEVDANTEKMDKKLEEEEETPIVKELTPDTGVNNTVTPMTRSTQ